MQADVEPFHAIAISRLAHDLKAQGRSIIHMEFGQPSTGAPSAAIARAHEVGLQLTPQQLFQNPTIAQLAVVVNPGQAGRNPVTRVPAAAPLPAAAVRSAGDFPLAGLDAQQFVELSDLISEIDNAQRSDAIFRSAATESDE